MKLFEFAWFPNFDASIEDLKSIAMDEDWDYKKKPIGKNPILVNYIKHTFAKLYDEGTDKVIVENGYALFKQFLATEHEWHTLRGKDGSLGQ